ncbi:MAG: transporter substrate-binding domain-containing protein [Syntrophaceae bacterium]|nr:transporter substrate-binding domain-containing protein [Syntrophaceae bacterium]
MKSLLMALVTFLSWVVMIPVCSADLDQIMAKRELSHLGVPYANFVTGDGEGLDAAIIKLYCKKIGVNYVYVKTDWDTVISDLSGKKFKMQGGKVEITGEAPIKGDIIGNGLTVIPWRQQIINYSTPYFPSAIWVIAKADSPIKPIQPTSDPKKDVEATRDLLKGKEVLGIKNTCVDLDLYNLSDSKPIYKEGITLNDLAAALIKGAAEISILDVPDSLVALSKFPGKIKILGSITGKQDMGFGFSKESPQLLASFNDFLAELRASGELSQLILKYYPGIDNYFPEVLNK